MRYNGPDQWATAGGVTSNGPTWSDVLIQRAVLFDSVTPRSRVISRLCGVVLIFFSGCGWRGEKAPTDLPQVFLYGDSIRIGYEPEFRRLSWGKWDVFTTGTINGGDTRTLVEQLGKGVPDGMDVYHMNCGLHDIGILFSRRVPIDEFEANWNVVLDHIFDSTPDAIVILATNTTFDEEFFGLLGKSKRYSEVIRRIVRERFRAGFRVYLNDLEQFVTENGVQTQDGLHYSEEGSAQLAQKVYSSISEVISIHERTVPR